MAENDKYLKLCKQIVLDKLDLDKYLVFLFGSRVYSHHRRFADVDIGVQGKEPVPAVIIEDIKEAIDESIVPYQIDVVDFYRVSPEFKRVALQNMEIWNRPKNHIYIS